MCATTARLALMVFTVTALLAVAVIALCALEASEH